MQKLNYYFCKQKEQHREIIWWIMTLKQIFYIYIERERLNFTCLKKGGGGGLNTDSELDRLGIPE